MEIPRDWRVLAGTHAIQESFVVRGDDMKLLWLRQGWESSQDLREFSEKAQSHGVKVEVKPPTALDRWCGSHQGAIAFVKGGPQLDLNGMENFDRATILALDGIEDPHNLGAIVRTAWLTGAKGLLIPEERAVGLTPTVHKVACGGAEHVPVATVTNFAVPIEKLKEQGFWVFGLSHKSEKTIFDLRLPEKVVWAIGAEDKGLRVTTERLCDELVSIPQLNNAASYNASVATAMALTETLRQHRQSLSGHAAKSL